MKFHDTGLEGAHLIEMTPIEDARGGFARTYCENEFRDAGLETRFVQGNMSYTHRANTIRGMHYQNAPHAEVKLFRCVRGALYDVIVDLRPGSKTYLEWRGYHLTEDNNRQIYVPEGFGHGFLSLSADTAVSYMVSAFYAPGAESGFRWNDPTIGIEWPAPIDVISDKDQNWADFNPQT